MITQTPYLIEDFEPYVERYTLREVLEALELMCRQKEDFLSVHLQDRATAKMWANDGNAIGSILDKIKN